MTTPDAPRRNRADDAVMGLLRNGIPLSLLLDLSSVPTPTSAEILAAEGAPEQEWWQCRRTG